MWCSSAGEDPGALPGALAHDCPSPPVTCVACSAASWLPPSSPAAASRNCCQDTLRSSCQVAGSGRQGSCGEEVQHPQLQLGAGPMLPHGLPEGGAGKPAPYLPLPSGITHLRPLYDVCQRVGLVKSHAEEGHPALQRQLGGAQVRHLPGPLLQRQGSAGWGWEVLERQDTSCQWLECNADGGRQHPAVGPCAPAPECPASRWTGWSRRAAQSSGPRGHQRPRAPASVRGRSSRRGGRRGGRGGGGSAQTGGKQPGQAWCFSGLPAWCEGRS